MGCLPPSTSSTSRAFSSSGSPSATAWAPARLARRWSAGTASGVAERGLAVALAVAAVAVLAAGCDRHEARPPATHERSARVPKADRSASRSNGHDAGSGARADGGTENEPPGRDLDARFPPPRFIGSTEPTAQVLERLETAPVRWFQPIGKTSVVFRAVFEDGSRATIEPSTRQYPTGYRREVAAYRIARLLGLDDVPPAITRRVGREELRERLDPEFDDVWDQIERWTRFEPDGYVPSAAVLWVADVRPLGLVDEAAVARWTRWLEVGQTAPADQRALARDLSNMVVFDYLIGNWARFDDPLQGTPDGGRLYLRQHNRAFAAPLPPVLHSRLRDRLLGVHRFSRRLVERLARLDRTAVEEALARDPGSFEGSPLLTAAQVEGVLGRREAILSYVGALVDEHGTDPVMSLP